MQRTAPGTDSSPAGTSSPPPLQRTPSLYLLYAPLPKQRRVLLVLPLRLLCSRHLLCQLRLLHQHAGVVVLEGLETEGALSYLVIFNVSFNKNLIFLSTLSLNTTNKRLLLYQHAGVVVLEGLETGTRLFFYILFTDLNCHAIT